MYSVFRTPGYQLKPCLLPLQLLAARWQLCYCGKEGKGVCRMLQNFGTAFSVGLRGKAGPATLEQPHIISLRMVHDMPWVGKYEKWRATI